jgi:hypothetical protein
LLGAPLAVRRALVAFRDMLAQFLKHLMGSEFEVYESLFTVTCQ